jgi:hypothetical protein
MAFCAPILLSNLPGFHAQVFEGRRRSANEATSGLPKTQAKIAAIKVLKIGAKVLATTSSKISSAAAARSLSSVPPLMAGEEKK